MFFCVGDDSINFNIRLMKCIDGKGTLSLTCTVQHLNVMKILKNGVEVSQCLTFPEYPYKYCEHSSPQDGNAKTNLHNCSMTYTIETAKTDLLPGNWACQNGGENDPSSNMKISIFTCKCVILFHLFYFSLTRSTSVTPSFSSFMVLSCNVTMRSFVDYDRSCCIW